MSARHHLACLFLSLPLAACAAAGGPIDTPVSPAAVEPTPSWLEPVAAPPADGFEMSYEEPHRAERKPTAIPSTSLRPERASDGGAVDGGRPLRAAEPGTGQRTQRESR